MGAEDVVLCDGTPRAEAFRDTKADSLSICCGSTTTVAELCRFPKSICVANGTGTVRRTAADPELSPAARY